MKKFRFPLETVLRWRRTRATQEEARLETLHAEHQRLQKLGERMDEELSGIEHRIKRSSAMGAEDLRTFDSYSRYASAQRQLNERKKSDCRARIAEQTIAVSNARRDAELLEKLKALSHANWQRGSALEMDTLAGELHLARLTRERQTED